MSELIEFYEKKEKNFDSNLGNHFLYSWDLSYKFCKNKK